MSDIDILLMVDNSLDTIGGSEESTKIIINGVKDKFSLGVIQPDEIKQPVSGVHYYTLTKKTRLKLLIKNPFSFIKYIWDVRNIICEIKPKIIHTQAQVSFFIVALLLKLRLIPKCFKLIHTERGLYIRYNTFFKKIFHSSMKELDVLITTTNYNMGFWKPSLKKRRISLDFRVIENTAGKL